MIWIAPSEKDTENAALVSSLSASQGERAGVRYSPSSTSSGQFRAKANAAMRVFSLSASNDVLRSRERERVVADQVRDVGEKHSLAERAGVRCRSPQLAGVLPDSRGVDLMVAVGPNAGQNNQRFLWN